MILVTGATGTVGTELVRQLSAAGAPVRALVRDPEKARARLGDGVELAPGDMEKPETLDAALQEVQRAFLLPPVDPGSIAMEENFLAAAKRAGLAHLVKLSSFGADPGSSMTFGRWHGQGEKLVEASGIPFTHLRPNSFMQNVLGFAGPIAAQGMLFTPAGDAGISHVDVRDIAAVAVKVLTEDGHAGKVYEITGPEALSYYDVAAKISAAIGKTVTYMPVSPEQATGALLGMGAPEWQARAVVELFLLYRSGEGGHVTDVVETVGKKTPITFDQFARDYAPAFLQAPS